MSLLPPEHETHLLPPVAPDSGPGQGYRVLARKYRPTDFSGLKGQDALVRTLTNAFATGRVAHAFMLTGVRGVGKTTTARIIAKGLNCVEGPTVTPCGVCDACRSITEGRCVDVLEMDAASRTGVDDIREIIEGVKYAPTSVRTKVYIIDEVHMLSKAAFNALLKTLEEPPPHVTFIFATTEIRKVPVTVLSRCQRFDLRRLSPDELMGLLSAVGTAEGGTIEPEALRLLARAADGSARDGLSLLDQALARDGVAVTGAQVRDMLGLADRSNTLDLLVSTLAGRPAEALATLDRLHRDGADALLLLQDLLDCVHQLARYKVLPTGKADPTLSEEEQKRLKELADQSGTPALARAWQVLLKGIPEVQGAPQPMAALEMLLIRLAHIGTLPFPGDLIRRLSAPGAAAALPSPASGIRPTPATTPPASVLRQATGGAGASVASLASASPAPAPALPTPRSWKDVVALVAERREMQLYAHLHSLVECQSVSPGHLEIFPRPGTPPQLSTRLAQGLSEWTGQRWMISLATTSKVPTLAEEEAEAEEATLREAREHPLVKAVLLAFPGARVESVVESVQEAVAGDPLSGAEEDIPHDPSASEDPLSMLMNDDNEE